MKNKFNIIHHYFTKLYEYSVALQKNFDAESIHAFRVTAKKLRALLRMLRCSKPGNKTMKLSRRIKNMYLLTGKIRDLQLCLQKINTPDCSKDPECLKQISCFEHALKKLKKKKEDIPGRKEFSDVCKRLKHALPARIDDNAVKKFFRQKMEAVSTIHKQPVYEDDDLHTARKCIKDVIYIIKIYQDDMQLPLPFMPWNKKELQKAEHIAHILGLFNDARIELDLLQSVCISKPGSHNIYSKWQKEKSKLKNKAVRSLCANHIYK